MTNPFRRATSTHAQRMHASRRNRRRRVAAVGGAIILLASVPGTTVVADDAAERAESEADYVRFGGQVAYGVVQADGTRTTSAVVITATIIAEATDRNIGSTADSDIIPPGFYDLGTNRSRGHLIGRQLGGSGDVEANLVAQFQNRSNSPVMSSCEGNIADYLRDGLAADDDLYYQVQPVYDLSVQDHPTAIWLYASDAGNVLVNILIDNTPEGDVTFGSGNAIC